MTLSVSAFSQAGPRGTGLTVSSDGTGYFKKTFQGANIGQADLRRASDSIDRQPEPFSHFRILVLLSRR